MSMQAADLRVVNGVFSCQARKLGRKKIVGVVCGSEQTLNIHRTIVYLIKINDLTGILKCARYNMQLAHFSFASLYVP